MTRQRLPDRRIKTEHRVKALPHLICQCCGQTLPSPVDFYGLRLTPMEKIILSSFQEHGRHGVSKGTLVEAVYDDAPYDGRSIDTTKARLNRKLEAVGKEIVHNRETQRYYLVDYREEARNVSKASNGSDARPSPRSDQRDGPSDRGHVADAAGSGGGLQGRRRSPSRLRGECTP